LLTREETSGLLTRKASKTLPTKLSPTSNSLAHMETTVFYASIIVINTFFAVSSCQDEGKISLASFDKLFRGDL